MRMGATYIQNGRREERGWIFGTLDSGIVDDFTSAVLRNRVQGVTARPGPMREDGPRALGCGPIHRGAEMFMVQSQGLLLTSR